MHKVYSNLNGFKIFKFENTVYDIRGFEHKFGNGCGDCAAYNHGVGEGLFDGDGWTDGYNGNYTNCFLSPIGDGRVIEIKLCLEETNA